MKTMPSRDTTGKCKGSCRDRVYEGEVERQARISASNMGYSTPAEKSPPWTHHRNEPPGCMGGRV
jgi:hypothetical protein